MENKRNHGCAKTRNQRSRDTNYNAGARLQYYDHGTTICDSRKDSYPSACEPKLAVGGLAYLFRIMITLRIEFFIKKKKKHCLLLIISAEAVFAETVHK